MIKLILPEKTAASFARDDKSVTSSS